MKASFGFLYFIVIFGALIGWVLNVVKLVGLFTTNAQIDTLFIGRILGVPFGPLGAVLGWF